MKRKDNIGYKIPEGYFDDLHKSIMDEVTTEKSSTKILPIKWISGIGIAASVALAIFVINPFEKSNNTEIETYTSVDNTEEFTAFEELTAEEFYEEIYSSESSMEDVLSFNNTEIIEL